MGLDITAYSNLVLAKHPEEVGEDDWCQDEDHIQAFAYGTFPRSFRGLKGWDLDGLPAGLRGGLCYSVTDQTETFGFRAGSYPGYNQWRQDLAESVGKDAESDYWGTQDDPSDLPFYELINFADNEGCIGPEAARDLLADFQAHDKGYRAQHADHPYFIEKYDDWTKACVLAAQSGLISFH